MSKPGNTVSSVHVPTIMTFIGGPFLFDTHGPQIYNRAMDTKISELIESNPAALKRFLYLNQQILKEAVQHSIFKDFLQNVLVILQKILNNDEVMVVTGPADKRTCYHLSIENGKKEFSTMHNAPQIHTGEDAEVLFRKRRHTHRSFNEPKPAEQGTPYSHCAKLQAGTEHIGTLVLASSSFSFTASDRALIDMIADTLSVAMVSFENQAALTERVKELTCLYRTAQLASRPELSIPELLQEVTRLIPPAWQYPDITVGKIEFDDQIFETEQYVERPHPLCAEIVVNEQKRGIIKVAYLENMPVLDEGPFLKEERNLINTLAHQLAVVIEQREGEAEQQKLQDQLLHADRLATIGKLAAGVAHELNEPLGNTLGFAQLLLKDESLSQETKADIGKIEAAALHGREIVRKLMLFARQTPPRKVAINLNTVVRQAISLLETRLANEAVDLDLQLTENIPDTVADASQLVQVVVNLVVNVLQAMPDGGKLTLQTTVSRSDVELVVTDTGMGMSDAVQQQAFLPFFTTKDVDQGTGLGLAVVHGIVSAHNGKVSVTSTPGEGATFTIRIPIIDLSNQSEALND